MLPGIASFADELEKLAWSWKGFREGVEDEGIPLGAATLGAFAAPRGKGLTGAALGYAGGGAISLLRSKLKGEEPSTARKVLALSALGYGAGGLAHIGLSHAAKPGSKLFAPHGAIPTRIHQGIEEAIPAAGAVLGAGVATATDKKKNPDLEAKAKKKSGAK